MSLTLAPPPSLGGGILKKERTKAHKMSQFGVSGKGGYILRTNVLITVGCNHSLPCLALKIREKKLLLNKSDKEW